MESVLIVGVLGALVGYLVYDTYFTGNREWVTSTIDDREYYVQSLGDKQAAADLLAQIRANMIKMRTHLERTAPSDPRTERIVLNFEPDKIQEGRDDKKLTSYSVNKQRVVFCLRSRERERALEDLNTMMFVALHELAHIATESVGHTDEFWANFRWILEHAVNIGIYFQEDYKSSPREYCGVKIASSPLAG